MGRYQVAADVDDDEELAEILEAGARRTGSEEADLIARRDQDYDQFMRSGGSDRLLEIDRRRARR